jgi:hypothetical protein
VIITNYNYARYLRDAIESALGQSYPGVEVIVVDDGSVDDSRDIIQAYDGRVVPVLKENGGQASAFTAGLARSHGDVVIFLDADDVLLPHTARQVADVLCANPDVAKIQYRMEMIDASGGRTGRIMPERYIPMRDGDLRAEALTFPADIPRMATSGNAFPAWVLQELAPIPETGDSVGADWYLAYISLLLGPVISIDGVGALYRTHGDNSFHASSLDLGQMRMAIRYIQYLHIHMKRHADRLGLSGMPDNPNEVRSVAFLVTRMVSLKLDPANHPIPEDTIASVLKAAVAAVRLRFDATFPMKVVFLLAFAALAAAPRLVAHPLATMIMQPESRGRLNGLLSVLHRFPTLGKQRRRTTRG